jgi:hypothetical protein
MDHDKMMLADLISITRAGKDRAGLDALQGNVARMLDLLYAAAGRVLGDSTTSMTFADPVDEQVVAAILLVIMTAEDPSERKYAEARSMFSMILREVCRDTVGAYELLVKRTCLNCTQE